MTVEIPFVSNHFPSSGYKVHSQLIKTWFKEVESGLIIQCVLALKVARYYSSSAGCFIVVRDCYEPQHFHLRVFLSQKGNSNFISRFKFTRSDRHQLCLIEIAGNLRIQHDVKQQLRRQINGIGRCCLQQIYCCFFCYYSFQILLRQSYSTYVYKHLHSKEDAFQSLFLCSYITQNYSNFSTHCFYHWSLDQVMSSFSTVFDHQNTHQRTASVTVWRLCFFKS